MLKVQKKPKVEKPTLINLKVSAKELKALKAKAKKYAKGNLSLWLRFTGLNHTPRRKDLA